MSDPKATEYTDDELAEFDTLTRLTSSPDQLDRIEGRLALRRFVSLHGKDKCDQMWKHIKAKEDQRGQ